MPRRYELIVGPSEASERLDRYLVSHLPESLSRAAVQRVIKEGKVFVGGKVAKANRQLKAGEQVVAEFAELGAAPRDAFLLAEEIPIKVVYEDEELLVVDKPPGLVTHPAPGHWSGTLVNAILGHYAKGDAATALPRAGIVHRLDKDTSGLLVIAKTEAALRALAAQLKDRTMSRKYLALVEGHVAFDEGTIDAAIGRHAKDRKLMAIRRLGGREAVSHYRVLKRLEWQFNPQAASRTPQFLKYSILEVRLQTGRTHQVRVHMAHVGHPVLGDVVYSRFGPAYWDQFSIHRQMLHAYSIKFLHPADRREIALTAPVPGDMMTWIPNNALPI